MRRAFYAVLVAFLLPFACLAQTQTGIYANGAFDAKTFDTINIGNLNVYFGVPVYSKPGRGLGFYYNLVYNSSIWTPASVSGSKAWTPVQNWGWTAETDAETGYMSYSVLGSTCLYEGHHVAYEVWSDYAYHDTLGVVHDFPGVETSNNPTCSGVTSSDSGAATDPSGYTISASLGLATITARDGRVITAPSLILTGTGSTVDANGNTISVNTSGQVIDTTGNTVLTISGTAPSPTTYTYTDTTNTSRTVTVNYSSYTVQTAFGCSGVSEFGPTNEELISSISYPDGTSYSFSYEPTPGVSGHVTGRLASVTLPEGGVIKYSYSGGDNGIECVDGGTATLTRTMPDDPLNPSTTYTRTPGTNSSHTQVVDGLSNYAEYDFVNDPNDPNLTPYLINYSQYEGTNTGTPLTLVQNCLNGATPPSCTGQSFTRPISSITTTSTLNGTDVRQSILTYNSYGLTTEDKEYDFGSGAPGAELSNTVILYETSGPAGLPYQVSTWVLSGSSSINVSQVSFYYDQNALTTKSGIPQLASVSGSRGNLTSIQYTSGASSPELITTAQFWYDNAGQVVKSEDANLNQTTYSYDTGTDTFQYGVTYPTTGGVAHSTSASWDVVRGLQQTSVDMNGNTTTYGYDLMLRPSTISGPGGWNQTFGYSFGPSSPYTSVSTLHATGGSYITATTDLDPYGRTIKTDSTDTPSDDLVTYAYDADGNLNTVSNPYRSGGTVSNTVGTFDALGRITKVLDSDGASHQMASYSGNSVTVTDAAGHQRELFVDGLGRTNKVMEPNSSGSLTLETDYLYSQNATQGSGSTFTTYQNIIYQKGGSGSQSNWRTRTVTFDMLGRTASSATPEAGTITYTYPNGSGSCAGIVSLACGRTDANGTSTTYSYDALNRATGRTYGGSSIGSNTPSVTYYYDQSSYNGLTISNGNGLRTGMSDGSGETAWSFDGMGRIAAIEKTINSVTKKAAYTYNADGSTHTAQDYGSTTFTYSYDVSGRPTGVVDGSSNSYAGSGVYNAAGELTALTHQLTASGGKYVRSIQYNTMLQPSVISATLNGNTIQSLSYGYGTGGTDNGNILSITNGTDSSRSQTYSYDYTNRLASGRDASHWGETYTYDNWGNLYETTPMSGLGGNNWNVTASVNNQLSNLTYDSAGEVAKDQYSNSYTYDAEGRIRAAGAGTYVYDGDGNRVEKTVSSSTTLYWPGTSGTLDESTSSGSTMGTQVGFNDLLVWHEDTTGTGEFLLQDQLGSTRMSGSAAGAVEDNIDYQSYGTLYHNYGASPTDNHYLFTGYESDSETTSDYAVFRNLGTTMSRFNRPDPYDGSYDVTNPQSLNRYSYALNNPLSFVDPMGLVEQSDDGDGNDAPASCVDIFCASASTPDACAGGCGSTPASGSNGGGGGGGNAPNTAPQPTPTCKQQRILDAIPGATLTNPLDTTGQSVGEHTEFGITVTADQLQADGFSPFSIFGVNNGYRNGGVVMQVHANGPGGLVVSQAHIDTFNPASGLFGILGHFIWDLGIGSFLQKLFPKTNGLLDPGC